MGTKDSSSEEGEEGDNGENEYEENGKNRKANHPQIIDQLMLEYISDTITDKRECSEVVLGKIRCWRILLTWLTVMISQGRND